MNADKKNTINQNQQPDYYGFVGISGSFTLDKPLDLTKFQYPRINLRQFGELLRSNSVLALSDGSSKGKTNLLELPKEKSIFLETQRSSYLIDYAYLNALDFTRYGENKKGLNRWTERALRINKKKSDSSEIFNSFFISTKFDDNTNPKEIIDFKTYSHLYTIEYDIMLLLALRQWELFVDSYLFRMYDLFLPPAKILRSNSGENVENAMVVIPYISLKRKPNERKMDFSRIVVISLIIIPTSNDLLDRRSMSSEEMFLMNRDETEIVIKTSPLKEFIKEVVNSNIFNGLASKRQAILNELEGSMPIRHLFKMLSFLILAINSEKFDENEWSLIANRLNDSFQYLKLIDIDYKDGNKTVKDDFKEFMLWGWTSKTLRVLLNDLVAPQGKLNIHSDRDVVDFRSLVINDPNLLEISPISFYNPFEQVAVAIITRDCEKFPTNSIKWGLSWYMKLIQSLSALTTLKNSYYFRLEHLNPTPETLSKIEDELLRDLDDFYDLEIRNWSYSYRMQFENSKKILGIDKSFVGLKEKISSVRTVVHTDIQTKLNEKVRNLTLFLILLTATLIAIEVLKFLNL